MDSRSSNLGYYTKPHSRMHEQRHPYFVTTMCCQSISSSLLPVSDGESERARCRRIGSSTAPRHTDMPTSRRKGRKNLKAGIDHGEYEKSRLRSTDCRYIPHW